MPEGGRALVVFSGAIFLLNLADPRVLARNSGNDVILLLVVLHRLLMEYRHIADWRQHANATPEMREKIATHDKLEKRLHETPKDVLREAHEAIDHGTSLLLKLIRSRYMYHTLEPTPKGKAAGLGPHSWDESFNCLQSRIDYMNRQLIRLAEANVPEARTKLFYQAKTLTAAFVRLAQAFPADFRGAAESSLTMPSLRARTPQFTADAQAIAKRIHLAEKHPASGITDNRERLGALCHVLVAEFVEAVNCRSRCGRKTFLTLANVSKQPCMQVAALHSRCHLRTF